MVGIHGTSLVLRERLDDLVKMQRLLVHCVIISQGSVTMVAVIMAMSVSVSVVVVVVVVVMAMMIVQV
jgi:hypothetical protein